MLEPKILCVDDEFNILEAYQRSLRKEFKLDVANGGQQGLDLIREKGPYAVIVSDMRMPGMDGVQFLSRVREIAPDSVRIMVTGNADQQTAVEAVNQGHIFRFLNKPCQPTILAETLRAGLEQYRLAMAEKELLEKTLKSSIQTLTEVLSLVNPTAFGRATRVQSLVSKIADNISLTNKWQVEIAAMLSQIGCITIPEQTLTKVYQGEHLNEEELRMWQSHPQVAHDLIVKIPRLEQVAEIVLYQEKRYNGAGFPGDAKHGSLIPIGARILKLALDFDKLTKSYLSYKEALVEIKRRGDWYDSIVVDALEQVLDKEITHELKYVNVLDLRPGMILAEDIKTTYNLLMVANGQEVTGSLYLRLCSFANTGQIKEPIKVLAPIIHESK